MRLAPLPWDMTRARGRASAGASLAAGLGKDVAALPGTAVYCDMSAASSALGATGPAEEASSATRARR